MMRCLSKSLERCEFADGACDFYREDSYTCTHNGGPYCDQWKKLKEQKQ